MVPATIPAATLLAGLSLSKQHQKGRSANINRERVDKTAQYCEQLAEKHIDRLKAGRSLGFWNTGIYILGAKPTTVHTVAGMLRAVYSGAESYVEPIRTQMLPKSDTALEWIQSFEHIPFPVAELEQRKNASNSDKFWHPLGAMYQTLSTPLNTEELSIATSLPRRDVPGLRFVRNGVRFATNPPPPQKQEDREGLPISLGNLMDTGVKLQSQYVFDIHNLTKHALIAGVTGSGKSTTCRRVLKELKANDIPCLIIEPSKEEYALWAKNWNTAHSNQKEQIGIYMPGAAANSEFKPEELKLNPFQPAGMDGKMMDYESRIERVSALLGMALPMDDVLPLLLEEGIHRVMRNWESEKSPSTPPSGGGIHPTLQHLIEAARRVVENRKYEKKIEDNLKACLDTRLGSLTRGRRGTVLNVPSSTPCAHLFERTVVVNLSRIPDDRDKALIMALLLVGLAEYRLSKYENDAKYRAKADRNELCHVALVEEAHRLLRNPDSHTGRVQAIVATMFSDMLSEFRAYGQGMVIVDQVPSRLISDAIKNTNFKIVHRLVARDDRSAMSSCMALRPDQEGILAVLPVGEVILCGDLDDGAAWVKVEADRR